LLGVALTDDLPRQTADWLRHVQNDLFDLGADLCVPETDPPPEHEPLRVTAEQIEKLEGWIDSVNERLEPLESFILPGGTRAAAHLHHARAVCRRVETQVLRLVETESINPNIAIYLNRLSDLLFVLARLCNNSGADDMLWKPGMGRGESAE
jgi:cob(I)alamin adenosyltransferase